MFGCVQTLFEAVKIDPSVTVYLLSDESIMRLLQPVSVCVCVCVCVCVYVHEFHLRTYVCL